MSERGAELILIQGLYEPGKASGQDRKQRHDAIAQHGPELGVLDHERLDGRGRGIANSMLQRLRGTAPPPDAVEIMTIDEARMRRSLASAAGRRRWRELVGCNPEVHDPLRSFILMGRPYIQLQGEQSGQRLLWFGNGLEDLSRAEFITHYTSRHGPLVASHAHLMGMRSYRQVGDEQDEYCQQLRELGLGQAPPPAVFGELVAGPPPLTLAALRGIRSARNEIEADEKRHINFSASMLLMTGRANR